MNGQRLPGPPARGGRLAVWLLSFALIAVAVAWAQTLAPFPELRARVTDLTGTLTPEQQAKLEQTLQEFETRKGTQIVVLIVPTTKPEAIEQYSLRVVEKWKPGRKKIDDGALLLIAKDDHELRMEVGYGLEGALTDATTHRIIDEVITPKFKTGDFYGGISAGVDRMLRVVEGEPLPAAANAGRVTGGFDVRQSLPVILLVALFVGGVLRAVLGRLPGAVVTGGIVGGLAWFFAGAAMVALMAGVVAFFFTLLGSGRGGLGGGLGGLGGMGGFGGGGSSGGGGFTGGGGGFGGGGSSGRW